VASLYLIRRRDRLECKTGRDTALYRSQKYGGRYTTKNSRRAWHGPRPAQPERLIQ
jgi:hypothetical protein